jgi:hypothetical protein
MEKKYTSEDMLRFASYAQDRSSVDITSIAIWEERQSYLAELSQRRDRERMSSTMHEFKERLDNL